MSKASEEIALLRAMFAGGLGQKAIITQHGGIAIRLTNKTGAASVKGTIVSASEATDNAFMLQSVELDGIGAVYEDGVADGEECFVVIAGIAQVILKDTTAATRGYWVQASATDGRAEVTTSPAGLAALVAGTHFKEIGHCLETVVAGTDVLAKIVMHFN